MKTNKTCDAVIVGGGAAGMMAAITAAEQGRRVLLIEKNPDPGKKLRITGKGRCNVTNNALPDDVMKNIPRNGKFLYSSVNAFPPSDVMRFFESIGVALKVERGNRVFPVSDKAGDIVEALKRRMKKLGVEVLNDTVRQVLWEEGHITGVRTYNGQIDTDHVLLATGGLSYPKTGSTGDGYRFAQEMGHRIVPCEASLVPLECEGEDCPDMQGLSLKNIAIDLINSKGKSVYRDFGEMLFTHFGVSGPVILSASAHMKADETYALKIDLKPALDEKKLDARILRDFDEGKNKNFSNILSGLVHSLMVPVAIRNTGIAGDTKANSVTKEQRKALIRFLKEYTLTVTGKRPIDEAVITSGGVAIGQINPGTMQSKLVEGLFFAGEIIDTDAYTGGFNLQIAWSTGHAAGLNI